MRPAVPVRLALSALLFAVSAVRAQAPSAAVLALDPNPKVATTLADGIHLLQAHRYDFARDSFLKANKIAGGQCVKCLQGAYESSLSLKDWKRALALTGQLAELATTPAAKSDAEFRRGETLARQAGEKAKPDQLAAIHAAYQAALALSPRNLTARYADACTLARMGQLDDAGKAFAVCADSAAPTDPVRFRARHFAQNPSLATQKMAPSFEVTTLDGQRFNLDDMGGRIVLIDFWATWCGPCNEELPHLRKIAQEFAGQPLVILSISWDSNEQQWKDFIGKQKMTWAQYRDADHTLSDRFRVDAIPHYFTIDSDGVLTAEMLGSGSDVEGKLRKLLKHASENSSALAARTSPPPIAPLPQAAGTR